MMKADMIKVDMIKVDMIDGEKLYDYFISGAKKLIHNEVLLNKINVFPIPDGDTGSNLSFTMKSIISQSKRHKLVYKTIDSISNIAVENAYGNSGMIFAEYFRGLAIETNDREILTIEEFVKICANAVKYAYSAVSNPKEGTILTVMREWTKELELNAGKVDFEKLISKSIDRARTAVDNTKDQLKELRRNNVVDAGAKGFLFFLEGILEFLKSDGNDISIESGENEINEEESLGFEDVSFDYEYRYCSEFLIETDVKKEYLMKELSSKGDSIVISDYSKGYKAHIHTNNPERVVELLIGLGTILRQKIDDMLVQSSIVNNRKNTIGIITDSVADLPGDFIVNEQITVIPLNLICNGIPYLDKLTMSHDSFYKNIDEYKLSPTSSQPSSSIIEKNLSYLLQYFDSIIGIFVSQKMSGTYNAVKKIAEKLDQEGKRITIIDSKLNSAAQGLLVQQASELVNKGLTHGAIVQKIEKLRENVHIFVSISDLKYMLRGGRIPKITGMILKKIRLKPVISIDSTGKGSIYKKTFNQKHAIENILKRIKKDIKKYSIGKYCVVYSDSENLGIDFSNRIRDIIKKEPEFIEPISNIVGLNAGRGCVAVAYIKGGRLA